MDNSQLARVKECVDELETRIAANERFLSVEGEFHYEIPVGDEESQVEENIVEQVAAFLGHKDAPLAEIVAVADLDIN